ncbi:MAG: VOC family protein [Pseudomonadota bacterium]
MIIPNLMVTDMAESLAFYCDKLGMTLKMTVNADKSFDMSGDGDTKLAVFAIVEWNGAELMLQTNASLAGDVNVFQPDQKPSASGTVYFRGMDGRLIVDRFEKSEVIKGPDLAWYGMVELYVRDPDGHVICLACPEGAPPA